VAGRCRQRCATTTISDPDAAGVDLVKRVFGPGTVEADRVYVGDVTYIRTWEGWLYLATVIDLASRRMVDWAMADHLRAELVCDALTMALKVRRPAGADLALRPRPPKAGSRGRRNTGWLETDQMLVEGLGRGLPTEGLTGSVVEGSRDGGEVVGGALAQGGALGEVLAQQTVGVLVGATLPGAVRVAEVDRQAGVDAQLGVLGQLRALIPGQRSAQLVGQRGDRSGDRITNGLSPRGQPARPRS